MGFVAVYNKKVRSKVFATKGETQAFIDKRYASRFIPSGVRKLARGKWSVAPSTSSPATPKPAPAKSSSKSSASK